jgi:hypothetical protein
MNVEDLAQLAEWRKSLKRAAALGGGSVINAHARRVYVWTCRNHAKSGYLPGKMEVQRQMVSIRSEGTGDLEELVRFQMELRRSPEEN